jgi:hypothetical protein
MMLFPLYRALWMAYKQREAATPEGWAALICKFAADPAYAHAASAEAFAAGPDDGWRYAFQRLPVHGKLLDAYCLNEIAGEGDTFTRALRVMDWLTVHTYYSGASVWSGYFNQWRENSYGRLGFAFDKPFSHALNCRHRAMIFADCLTAVGIYAMPLVIMPGHLVVHVWLPEEHRWIMLDPSLNSYITDNDDRALNLVEIHDHRRQGKKLCVAQYSLNGTQDCRGVYLDAFVLNSLQAIHVCNGSDRKGSFCNQLLPEDVPLKDKKARAITAAELLAEPQIGEGI